MLDRIQKACKIEKYTIKSLETECHFGNGTIRRWEESSPSIDKLAKIANILNLSLDYLVFGKEQARDISDVYEEELLKGFRSLSAQGKNELLSFLKFKLDSEFKEDFMSSACPNGNGSTGGSSGQNLA